MAVCIILLTKTTESKQMQNSVFKLVGWQLLSVAKSSSHVSKKRAQLDFWMKENSNYVFVYLRRWHLWVKMTVNLWPQLFLLIGDEPQHGKVSASKITCEVSRFNFFTNGPEHNTRVTVDPLKQQSKTLFAPQTSYIKDNIFMDQPSRYGG